MDDPVYPGSPGLGYASEPGVLWPGAIVPRGIGTSPGGAGYALGVSSVGPTDPCVPDPGASCDGAQATAARIVTSRTQAATVATIRLFGIFHRLERKVFVNSMRTSRTSLGGDVSTPRTNSYIIRKFDGKSSLMARSRTISLCKGWGWPRRTQL